MAVLLGVSRLCRLVFYICGIHVYVSTQSVEFTEPTECSPDCSFMNAQGKLRQFNVRQTAISLPTSLSCSSLLPDQFLTNEDKDMPPRLDIGDVKGMFTQSSSDDLKVKIDIEISEPNHNRLNGVFLELNVKGNSDKTFTTRYCFLLDFNGTLTRNDIIPSYENGGDLTLSFYPCMDASKSAKYEVVGYPLPLITKPMDASRNNHLYSFSWFFWQVDKCKTDSKRYLEKSELKIYDGRLELKLNSSSLFNYNCPLAFRLLGANKDKKETVHFNNGAVACNIERGEYKMKFILDGLIGNKSSLANPMDVDFTFKGNCLSFPCGNSSICQQQGKKKHKCSCPPGQILKDNECYDGYPCTDNPCGNGTCRRIETSTSIHHICTCYRGFYEAHNTCMLDPCNGNPCGRNGECNVIKSDSGIHYSCDCNPGYFETTDLTCKLDPCFINPCKNGTCSRIKTDSGIDHECRCHDGFYNSKNTCEPDPCLDNPCGSGTCTINEDVKSKYECSCFTGFYFTQNTCKRNPCTNNPCGNGTCRIIETSTSIHYICTCYRNFYEAHNTCLPNPCKDNPCGRNGECKVIESDLGIHYSCDCYPGYFGMDLTCEVDPCFNNPCGNGTCNRIEIDSVFDHKCQCHDGFYNFQKTCKIDPCFNNPCWNGICSIIEKDSGIDRKCRCHDGFYNFKNTCKPDPCLDNPCGNGTCTPNEDVKSNYDCQCFTGFYSTQDTCKKSYCYGNQCHPGNCTEEDSSFTCNCPSSHQLIDGKCLENESVVMHVVAGLAGGLIGFLMILIFLYIKSRCPKSIDDSNSAVLCEASSFDKFMLDELKAGTSSDSSLAPSSAQPTVAFTGGHPFKPVRYGNEYHSEPDGVLASPSVPYNRCQETCRLSCSSHQPQFQENGPKAGDADPWREQGTFIPHSAFPCSRDVSIDSQPSTSNYTSVEYYTDRESSF